MYAFDVKVLVHQKVNRTTKASLIHLFLMSIIFALKSRDALLYKFEHIVNFFLLLLSFLLNL